MYACINVKMARRSSDSQASTKKCPRRPKWVFCQFCGDNRGLPRPDLVEHLFTRFRCRDGTEFLFVFVEVVGESRDDAFHMARCHDDPGNQMGPAWRSQQPVYHELFWAVGHIHVVTVSSSGHFIAGADLKLSGRFFLFWHVAPFSYVGAFMVEVVSILLRLRRSIWHSWNRPLPQASFCPFLIHCKKISGVDC